MGLPQVGAEAVITNLPGFNRAISQVNKGLSGAGKSAINFASSTGAASSALSVGLVGAATVAVAGIAAVAAGVVTATGAIISLGVAGVKTAIEVESAFAGVLKTTDGLGDSFNDLTAEGKEVLQGFRDLSLEIPTDISELMGIGELAGQLGVASDQLVDFTKTMAALGEATNLTGEEAATAIAQIQNIFEVASDDMAENAERFGSSIVALGNNFATTERDILNFAQRIAGAGKIVGLTQDDILGIAAAFTSVGVEAEAGGTAVQKVLLELNKAILEGGDSLELFAKTAGLTSEEFAKLFEEDAAQAFNLFVQGLGKAGDEAGFILDDLGLKDQRLTRAFLSLAQSGDLLTETLGVSNQAFIENTALTEEAAKRYATAQSQIQLFKNTLKDLSLTIGQALLPAFADILSGLRQFIASDAVRKLFESLGTAFQHFVQILSEGALGQRLLPALAAAFGLIIGDGKGLIIFFEVLAKTINKIIDFVLDLMAAFKSGSAGNILEVLGFSDKAISNIEIFIEAVQRIFQAVAPILQAIFNIFAEVFKGIASLIAGAFGDVDIDTQGGFEGFISFLEGVATAIEDSGIAEFLEEIAEKVAIFFDLLAQGDPQAALFSLGFSPEAVAGILTAMTAIQEAFNVMMQIITEDIMPVIRTAIEELKPTMDEIIVALIALKPLWDTFWQGLKVAVVVVVGIIIGLIIGLFAIVTAIFNAWAEAMDFLKKQWQEMADAVQMITEGQIIKGTLKLLWEMIKTFFGLILKLAQGFIEGLIKFFTELKDRLIGKSIIPDMLRDILKAFTVFGGELLASVLEIINNIIGAFSDSVSDFIDLGVSLMMGLLKGIQSVFQKIKDAIGGFIDDLFGAAEEAAGIFSPSKRAIKIGMQIDEGLALGMLKNIQLPVQAIQGVVDATLGQQQRLVPALSPVQQGPSVTTISNSRTFAPTVQAQSNLPLNEDRIMQDLMLLNMIDQGG